MNHNHDHILKRRPHVALIIETSINYGRGILRGVSRYLRENEPWSVFIEQRELGASLPDWIDHWNGDGIITRSDDPRILKAGIPTVGLYDRIDEDLGLPMILNDSREVGRLAATHMTDRGFGHFAFLGPMNEYWSQLRLLGVKDIITGDTKTLDVYDTSDPAHLELDWENQQNRLAEWLAERPKPLGLIASNDIHGLKALDACQRTRIAVPEEVAVIGADNDEELCDISDPPMSSVNFHPERIGYEAAALLDRMMRQEEYSTAPRLVEPLGAVTRHSTDILAIDDNYVAQALHIIRRHACEGITVEAILDHLPISRRSLEQRFRKVLGRTPKSEIQRVQFERARILLAETDLSITAVGRQIGFRQPAYFSTAFKAVLGKTPSQYRRSLS